MSGRRRDRNDDVANTNRSTAEEQDAAATVTGSSNTSEEHNAAAALMAVNREAVAHNAAAAIMSLSRTGTPVQHDAAVTTATASHISNAPTQSTNAPSPSANDPGSTQVLDQEFVPSGQLYTDEERQYLAQILNKDVEGIYFWPDIADRFNEQFEGEMTDHSPYPRPKRTVYGIRSQMKHPDVKAAYDAWSARKRANGRSRGRAPQ